MISSEAEREERKNGGEWRIRTTEGVSQQIYSLPRLTAPETPHAPFLSARNYTGEQEESSEFRHFAD